MNTDTDERPTKVFLSYSQADRALAEQVAATLHDNGLAIWFDRWELASGDAIRGRVDQAVQSSDLFIVFLSRASASSHWVKAELASALATEMDDRAILIIPVLIEKCEIPQVLENRFCIDFSSDLEGGIKQLARQLVAAKAIDLANIAPVMFERLVGDLLSDEGLVIQQPRSGPDLGYDFVASRTVRDPHGIERTETWAVEVKAYKNQRFSLAAVNQLITALESMPADRKGLLVTNGRLTSVARDFLTDAATKAGREVRVLEGSELRTLLLRKPQLVAHYFAQTKSP